MHRGQVVFAIALGCTAAALGVAGVLGGSEPMMLGAVVAVAALIGFVFGVPRRQTEHASGDALAALAEHAPALEMPASPAEPPPGPVEAPASPAPSVEPAAADVSAPPPPDPAPPVRLQVRMPQDLECPSVMHTLLSAADQIGSAVSTHMWLEDPATATLRMVYSAGPMAPDPTPVPSEEGALGTAVAEGTAQIEAVADVAERGSAPVRLWRFALPLRADETRGVAAIDFRMAERPDPGLLTELAGSMRGALTGCLALHVSRTDTEAARLLLDLARDLSRMLDRDEVISLALSRAMTLSGAATGSVMLIDKESDTMRIAQARGLPADVIETTVVTEGEGIAGWVLATGQPLLIEDLPGRGSGTRRHGVRSSVSVPIGDEDGMLGVLNVGSRQFPARFTNSHLRAIEVIGKQTAVALRNATALDSVREAYFDTLRALAIAMETKDPYASGGTARTVEYVNAVGQAMGLSDVERQSLEIAALLHDIGMGVTGDSVATAARPLSTVERGLLKMHPVLAAEIIQQAPALHGVVPIVYHHHEWYDGQGYVGGLSGESIPFGARILSVADAFVAMTSDRPYRRALTVREAIKELREKAGTQFDPQVVQAFVDIYGERRAAPHDEPRQN